MGQGDIINYLRKCKKPKSSGEISKATGSNANRSLRILRKSKTVKYKKVQVGRNKFYVYWL